MSTSTAPLPPIERATPGEREWLRLQADHLSRYLFAAPFARGKRVLDAGTGPGYGAAILQDAGATEVVAADIDPATIEQAQRAYGAMDGLRFVQDDCETLERAGDGFDVICSFENIEHLQRPERFLQQAARRRRPGGLLLCSTPDRGGLVPPWQNGRPVNPFHVNEWYADDFLELLDPHFESIDFRTQVLRHAAVARSAARKGMQDHLDYLWQSQCNRIGRLARRLLGRPMEWPDITSMDVPAPEDYPIVSRRLTSAFGVAWCHVVICWNGKRGESDGEGAEPPVIAGGAGHLPRHERGAVEAAQSS